MSDLTAYREGEVAAAVESNGVYVALHSSDPGNSPDGSTELSAGGYSRQQVDAADLSTSGSGPTTLTTDVDVVFGPATEDWPTVSHLSLWDGSASTDNPEAAGALDSNVTVNDGDELKFSAGDIALDID